MLCLSDRTYRQQNNTKRQAQDGGRMASEALVPGEIPKTIRLLHRGRAEATLVDSQEPLLRPYACSIPHAAPGPLTPCIPSLPGTSGRTLAPERVPQAPVAQKSGGSALPRRCPYRKSSLKTRLSCDAVNRRKYKPAA